MLLSPNHSWEITDQGKSSSLRPSAHYVVWECGNGRALRILCTRGRRRDGPEVWWGRGLVLGLPDGPGMRSVIEHNIIILNQCIRGGLRRKRKFNCPQALCGGDQAHLSTEDTSASPTVCFLRPLTLPGGTPGARVFPNSSFTYVIGLTAPTILAPFHSTDNRGWEQNTH